MSAAVTPTPEFYSEYGEPLPIARITPAIELVRYCSECNAETSFIADRVCLNGHLGFCVVCGGESIVPFSRTTSEVA